MALVNDLFNREGEFRIRNSEIEAKAAHALKKADEIVRNQEGAVENFISCISAENDNACGDSLKTNNELHSSYLSEAESFRSDSGSSGNQLTHRIDVKNVETKPNFFIENEIEHKKAQEAVKCLGFKQERENIIANVLKAKIKELQEESVKKTEQVKKRNIENESLKKINQRLQEDKIKLCSQINILKGQSSKFDSKIANLTDKIQIKENECKALFIENEGLNKAAKEYKQNISKVEVRLARALEELGNLTEQLTTLKMSKKELAETSKKKTDELSVELERTKRKNMQLIAALGKQGQLVDNLKRQIIYLKTGKEVKSVDEKLENLLHWNV